MDRIVHGHIPETQKLLDRFKIAVKKLNNPLEPNWIMHMRIEPKRSYTVCQETDLRRSKRRLEKLVRNVMLWQHITLAPSVGQIRQKPSSVKLLACTLVGMGKCYHIYNTIRLFDRMLFPLLPRCVQYQLITAKWKCHVAVGLIKAKGQKMWIYITWIFTKCVFVCASV